MKDPDGIDHSMGIKGESADQVGRGGVAESIDAWKKGQAAQGIIDRTITTVGIRPAASLYADVRSIWAVFNSGPEVSDLKMEP